MSNGLGEILVLLIGFGCIVGGVACFAFGSVIESEEGLNITINETTPEGKAQTFTRDTLYLFGVVLIIVGIIIIAIGLLTMSKG